MNVDIFLLVHYGPTIKFVGYTVTCGSCVNLLQTLKTQAVATVNEYS